MGTAEFSSKPLLDATGQLRKLRRAGYVIIPGGIATLFVPSFRLPGEYEVMARLAGLAFRYRA